jgi:epoxyqueuosine reductase
MTLDAQLIKEAAMQVGFDACGIAAAASIPRDEWDLREWLADGRQADMHYMEEHVDKRYDPTLLFPGAKSVISVLLGYKPSARMQGTHQIAQYAYGEDYHERMKRMLYQLLSQLKENYPQLEARPFVDTAPISDKYWAVQAGLGWRGKNTLLVNPKLGSYCYIGELVTTFEADHYDTPMRNGCGDCKLCVHACPNHAIVSSPLPRVGTQVDARRCASYHTIENRAEQLPDGIQLSGYAFGCDCCQLVCPYNQQAMVRYELTEEHKQELEALPSADEKTFKKATKHSALNRIKYAQWKRNL